MFPENRDGKVRIDCSHVGYPTKVLTTITHADRCSKDSATTTGHSQMPGRKGMTHALIKKMTLMVCRVSGDPLKHKEFQNELQTSYYNLGNREHENNMHRTSNGGLSIAIGNMSVVLIILFP